MRVIGMLMLVLGLAMLYEMGPKGLTLDQTWQHLQDVLHLSNVTASNGPTKGLDIQSTSDPLGNMG